MPEEEVTQYDAHATKREFLIESGPPNDRGATGGRCRPYGPGGGGFFHRRSSPAPFAPRSLATRLGDAIVPSTMGQNLRPSRLTHGQRDLLWLVAAGVIAFVLALVATGVRSGQGWP